MPYAVVKSGNGYKVMTTNGPHAGNVHSKRNLTKQNAMAQMRAMYASSRRYSSRSLPRSRPRSRLSGGNKKRRSKFPRDLKKSDRDRRVRQAVVQARHADALPAVPAVQPAAMPPRLLIIPPNPLRLRNDFEDMRPQRLDFMEPGDRAEMERANRVAPR